MSLDPQNYKPFRDESMRFDEDEDEDILFLASKRKVICGNGSVLHEQSESLNIFPTGKRIKEQHSSDLGKSTMVIVLLVRFYSKTSVPLLSALNDDL